MRIVVQRVREAAVTVDGTVVGSIGRGLLVLLGIEHADARKEADYLVGKTAGLRIFRDEDGKMNRSVTDVGGSVLVVSQFTLYGDCRKGRRPSFVEAAAPAVANALYERFVQRLRATGVAVQTGQFGAMMAVELVNDGPVTLILDSEKSAGPHGKMAT